MKKADRKLSAFYPYDLAPVCREFSRQMVTVHPEPFKTFGSRDNLRFAIGGVQPVYRFHQPVMLIPVGGVEHIALRSGL